MSALDRRSAYFKIKEKAEGEAQQQEYAIRQKLEKEGLEFPAYQFLEIIGKGAFGRVYKCRDLHEDRYVALKVMDTDSVDFQADHRGRDDSIQSTLNEIKVLAKVSGSNSVNINPFLGAFQLHSQIWIINEYCPGGSLRTLCNAYPGHRLEEKYIKAVARELAAGLRFIHDQNIVHRDIKAGNVMIREDGAVQIIDFGVSGILETKQDKRSTFIGTPPYMPLEMFTPAAFKPLNYSTEVSLESIQKVLS